MRDKIVFAAAVMIGWKIGGIVRSKVAKKRERKLILKSLEQMRSGQKIMA